MLPLVLLCCVAVQAGELEETDLRQLVTVRRVYVDRLVGGEPASQMREILIGALHGAKLFVLTEKEDRADAVLRGAAEDMVFTEQHATSDSINARANFGMGRSSNRTTGGAGIGENESERSTERRHEAMASVRLVNKDGDVIWSTTQESLGAKFRGASADVADKITTRLKDDFVRARKLKQIASEVQSTAADQDLSRHVIR
jgi:hypothetical protein